MNLSYTGILPKKQTSVFFIRAVCFTLMVSVGYNLGKLVEERQRISAEIEKASEEIKDLSDTYNLPERSTSLTEYELVIFKRNIFGQASSDQPIVEEIPLRVAMAGQFGKHKIAIIEYIHTDSQDLFEEGDTVFELAKVLYIGEGYVDILYNDSTITLYIDEGEFKQKELQSDSNLEVYEITEVSFRNYEIKRDSVIKVLNNLKSHLNKAHSRVYNGGIVVYGMEKDSIFKRLGLAEFDVIKQVNGYDINSFITAQKIFSDFKDRNLEEFNLTISRAGIDINLQYRLVN